MFERFTERARRVVILAQEEARRLSCSVVVPEHILLAIIREGEGVGSKILDSIGVDRDRIRINTENAVQKGSATPNEELTFDRPSKKILELALDEAKRFGHSYIGTEHLLLGLIREENNLAAKLLIAEGATLECVRAQTVYLLGESPPKKRPEDFLPVFRVIDPHHADAAHDIEFCLNQGYVIEPLADGFVMLHRKSPNAKPTYGDGTSAS